MADITLSYKGSTIATMSASGSKTIQTAGKYCEDDISLTYISANPNDTSEPALPDAYKRVEYLDFQPSVGILVGVDSTNYYAIPLVDFMSRKATGISTAFGYKETSSSSTKDFQIGANGNAIRSYVAGSSDYGASINNNASYTIGSQATARAFLKSPKSTAFIGKYGHYQGSSVAANDLDGRVYQVKIVNTTTYTISNWYVPCRRIVDNVLGFFDHITQIFYSTRYSQDGTTATITAGPDVN